MVAERANRVIVDKLTVRDQARRRSIRKEVITLIRIVSLATPEALFFHAMLSPVAVVELAMG